MAAEAGVLARVVAEDAGALLASLAQADETSRAVMLPAVQEMQPLPPFGDGGLGTTLATIGAFLIAASLLIFFTNIWLSYRDTKKPGWIPPGPDPWDARSIEWMTASPARPSPPQARRSALRP